MTDQLHTMDMATEASLTSSEETVARIEMATEMNEDPAVAEVLEDAAAAADTTATRVGWLRSLLRRFRFERAAHDSALRLDTGGKSVNPVPQPFSYEVVDDQSGTTTLRLHGELDMAASPTLTKVLHELQHGATQQIVIDLRGLSLLDSMGLSALLEAHTAGRDGHRTVSFVAGGRSVHRVFQVTKMDERVTWVEPPGPE